MSKLDIPVLGEDRPNRDVRPEKPTVQQKKNAWAITPKGLWGDAECARVIDFLRKRGANAVILNEHGRLEFGVVERDDAPSPAAADAGKKED